MNEKVDKRQGKGEKVTTCQHINNNEDSKDGGEGEEGRSGEKGEEKR